MSGANYPRVYLYQRIVKAKLYIDAHYKEQLDLDNISDEAYFSKFHFIRTFKSIYGKTPHQYLTAVRIDAAKLLLKEEAQVSAVCLELGFESISSFSGLFKRHTGLTPSEYRQSQLELQKLARTTPQLFVPSCFGNTLGFFEKSNFQEPAL
jgi:AraC-like DNA-binding protein